jgi:aminopeptidase N
MLAKIATFEFRYQIRQPVFWASAILFFLLPLLMVTTDSVHIGDSANVHKNSPFNIAQVCLVLSLFYMFAVTAFVANVILRDDETGYGPLVYATRMTKLDYLGGRFLGGYFAAVLGFAAVPLGIFVGSLAPWVDPDLIGPNRWGDYAFAYLILAAPAIFITSALLFAVTTITRSLSGAFIGVVCFLVAWVATNTIVRSAPEMRHLLALLEPLGFGAFGDATRYWTAAERNTLVPNGMGVLAYNRLIDFAAGLVLLIIAYQAFRFSRPGAKARKAGAGATAPKARIGAVVAPSRDAAPAARPILAKPVFDAATARAQFWVRTRLELGQLFRQPAFAVLICLGALNAVGGLMFADEVYGTHSYPVTRQVINVLSGAFSIIPLIIAIFYAGELVWRERDRKTQEIIDASGIADWAFVAPKTLAIFLVIVATNLFAVLTGVAFQAMSGYSHFELGRYLVWFVAPQSVDAFLLAALAVFIQTIVPHKFWGWGLMLVYLVATTAFGMLGWEDPLYLYGAAPTVPLSDMNGQGHFWIAATWLRLYWGACAGLLLVLSHGLWRRGTETRLRPRLARLPGRLKGPAGALAGLCLVVFAGTGVFIYVNTHLWNPFITHIDAEARQADYEKTLGRYEAAPEPSVSEITAVVDLYPKRHALIARGRLRLVNRTGAPLQDIHVRSPVRPGFVQTVQVAGARPVQTWPRFGVTLLRLAKPLAPGETVALDFTTSLEPHGFSHGEANVDLLGGGAVLDNGTFVNSDLVAPGIGISRQAFLSDRSLRHKYHLKPTELHLPTIDSAGGRDKNALGGRTDWANTDLTVSTDADQTPIAPGYRVSEGVAGGRRIARFKSDAPIMAIFSMQSARYVEKHEIYKGVDIGVFHDAQHPTNVDRMIAAAKLALDYDQANFSPYQFHQLRFIEFPDYSAFAESFANTVPWSESLGFIADVRDWGKIDYVTYVGAHEIGHQWWAHQLIGANVQGGAVLEETMSQYCALMAMEKLYGPDKIRQFTKYELDRYLRSRGAASGDEPPLARVEDQGDIYYRKGSLVMYLLKDQIGEEAVNRALRSMLKQYAFKGAPYPTADDLVAAFKAQAPADKQGLIDDLFEKITLYDVKATSATAKRRPDGRWAVHMTVDAKKLYADKKGKETEAPMVGESYDFGVFNAKPGDGAFDRRNVLLFQRLPLNSGRHSYDFVVDRKPSWVGVDPYNKRIDRNADDNLMAVGG